MFFIKRRNAKFSSAPKALATLQAVAGNKAAAREGQFVELVLKAVRTAMLLPGFS